MSESYSNEWPDGFDFEKDETCQKIFKPYIEEQLKLLKKYDDTRNHLSGYRFHIHAVESAEGAQKTAIVLGVSEHAANNIYWAMLIHDLGKTELPAEIWDVEGAITDEQKLLKRTHTKLGVDKFTQSFKDIDHPFKDLALDIMSNHHKAVHDGMSMATRLAAIVEHYDGQSHPRAYHVKLDYGYSASEIFARSEEKYPAQFDEGIYQSFKEMKLRER